MSLLRFDSVQLQQTLDRTVTSAGDVSVCLGWSLITRTKQITANITLNIKCFTNRTGTCMLIACFICLHEQTILFVSNCFRKFMLSVIMLFGVC